MLSINSSGFIDERASELIVFTDEGIRLLTIFTGEGISELADCWWLGRWSQISHSIPKKYWRAKRLHLEDRLEVPIITILCITGINIL